MFAIILETWERGGIVLAAMYMLRWVSAVLHEREGDNVGLLNPPDLRRGALVCVLPLVLGLIALSIAPAQFTDRIDAAATSLIVPAAKEAAKGAATGKTGPGTPAEQAAKVPAKAK